MNINEMEAGPEMDALVAELMEWKIAYDPLEDRNFYCLQDDDPEWCDFDYYVDEWQPSSDIAAAWLVVEKLLPHFRIEYFNDSDYTDKKGWHADFWLESGHGCAEGCATAPLAICRAALKAAEAE